MVLSCSRTIIFVRQVDWFFLQSRRYNITAISSITGFRTFILCQEGGGGAWVQKIIMENTTLDPRKHRRPETDLFFYHTFFGEVFRSLCLAASLTGVPMSFDTSRLVIFQGIITHHRWKKDMIRELGREGLRVRACFSGTLSPPVLPEPSEWLFSSLCPRKKKKHEFVPNVIC